MRVAVFSAQRFERDFLQESGLLQEFGSVDIDFLEARLEADTAKLAMGYDAVCAFVNDSICAATLKGLKEGGVRCLLLRCAGFNNVDLAAAAEHGICVLRVPAYSPYAVAEFGVALLLALARKTHRAYARVRDGNFAAGGLTGFELHGRTVGVIGTGKIGRLFARILAGFGATVLAYDVRQSEEAIKFGCEYVPMDELLSRSEIVSLHCPLLPSTRHMIDAEAIGKMKRGATLINVSRGELMDTRAVVDALKSGQLGALGADVYEGEAGLFFHDLSGQVLKDDTMMTLQSLPNVLLTPHVAFLTDTALGNIWTTTFNNVLDFDKAKDSEELLNQLKNQVVA